jgi:hypothetical protein
MKRRLSSIVTAIVLVLSLTGCFNQLENELGHLSRRIKAMEDNLVLMNENISTLHSLVNKLSSYDFVTKITRIYDNYEVIGYTISFSNSPSITIYNGKDAQTPIISVKKAEDGIFYWVVSYSVGHEEFITNNVGQRIPAVAVTPKIKIENGNWMVTYDGGYVWHNLGKATGSAGTSFIKNVSENDGYVRFNFLDGSYISIPTLETYDKLSDIVNKTNSNVSALAEVVDRVNKGVYAKNITPIIEERDTIGYNLYLSDGKVMTFYNGIATNLPTIGAAKDPATPRDTNYYWTIKYEGDKGETGNANVNYTNWIGFAPAADWSNYTPDFAYFNHQNDVFKFSVQTIKDIATGKYVTLCYIRKAPNEYIWSLPAFFPVGSLIEFGDGRKMINYVILANPAIIGFSVEINVTSTDGSNVKGAQGTWQYRLIFIGVDGVVMKSSDDTKKLQQELAQLSYEEVCKRYNIEQ